MNAYDILEERGFVQQATDREAVRSMFAAGPTTFYIGFDPTASSLHAGSLTPIMAMAHVQRAGHRPIVILGGGTAMIGDPSGKTELRRMMTRDEIAANGRAIAAQIGRFVDLTGGRGLAIDNADWLFSLNYIDFLRDVGRHFSVNRMLTAEAYRLRLETGLSFLEFNYQILQAYDFLVLFREHGCTLQMGGDDQWGNILAGTELIRRIDGADVQAVTFPLLTTASGAKMGKTASGAVWLDGERFSAYDYFQYWVNADDADLGRFLALFTFLPMNEIRGVGELQGAELNAAKRVLAFEATRLNHGDDAAREALAAAAAAFGPRPVPPDLLPSSAIPRDAGAAAIESVPTSALARDRLAEGIGVLELIADVAGLTRSRGEARRLVQQGGVYINEQRIEAAEHLVTLDDMEDGAILLRCGKKRHHRIVVAD